VSRRIAPLLKLLVSQRSPPTIVLDWRVRVETQVGYRNIVRGRNLQHLVQIILCPLDVAAIPSGRARLEYELRQSIEFVQQFCWYCFNKISWKRVALAGDRHQTETFFPLLKRFATDLRDFPDMINEFRYGGVGQPVFSTEALQANDRDALPAYDGQAIDLFCLVTLLHGYDSP